MQLETFHPETKSSKLVYAHQHASGNFLRTVTLICLCLSLSASRLAGNEVTKWNEIAGNAAFASGLAGSPGNPLFESRVYAITHAAIHDALNAIDRRYEPYAFHGSVTPNASPEAAVATAAYQVLVNQFNLLIAYGFLSQQAMLDAAYASSLALIPDGSAKTQGINIGTTAANSILTLRANDGWDKQVVLDTSYPQGTDPGEFRFLPGTNFAFLPRWGTLPPFALFRANQYRPGLPYRVDSKKYAEDFNEIKSLGGDGVTTPSARTQEQTLIALFWLESSPLGWNRIARILAAAKGLGLWESARLFGLLNLALADGYIANFDTKAHYNRWRPITAIREAATDGNPDTPADPTWMSLVPAPAGPEYDSGHALEGGAAAEVMRLFFGTDEIPFTTCSTTLPAGSTCYDPRPVTRSFSSLSQAAEENALSRILVGFHFRNAINQGLQHGSKLGHHTIVHYMRPLR
jgi:hypothetical protein